MEIPAGAKIVTSRALNVRYGGHIANGSKHAVDDATEKGYAVYDNVAEAAVHDTVHQGIETNNPLIFFGAGHGGSNIFTGDGYDEIFNTEDCDILAGRITDLHACLCGATLGPTIIEKGGLSFLGSKKEWGWMVGPGTDPSNPESDPYDHPYSKGFWESANQYMVSLCSSMNTEAAYTDCYEKYNEWIDYWKESGDIYAAQLIGLLAYDRDIMVLIEEGFPPPPPPSIWKTAVAMSPIFGIGLMVSNWDAITKLFQSK